MPEHVHEWRAESIDYEGLWIRCVGCREYLSDDEISRRLNATERLKKLVADLQEDAKDGPNEMGGPFVAVSVIASRLEER